MNLKMSSQIEQIIKSTEKAIKFALGDPETALMYARRAAEAVCKEVYEEEFKANSKGISLGKMIALLFEKSTVLPRKVMYSLRVIQNFGGINAHPSEKIDECLKPALEFFSIIIAWYFEDYRNTKIPEEIRFQDRIQEGPFFPPVELAKPAIPTSGIEVTSRLVRAYSLFGYETDGGRNSGLWNDPYKFHELLSQRGSEFYDRYHTWLQSKRKFSPAEIIANKWIKVADHGYQHLVQFHPDGILTERSLFSFDEADHWVGSWSLIDDALRMNVGRYELDIIASRDGVHSGIEDEDDHRNAYFRVIHLQ